MLEDDVARALARLHALDPDDPNVTVDHDRTDMRRVGAALYAVDIAHTTLVEAVAIARHNGRSWTEIANVLGVSRQAARQRFGKEVAELASTADQRAVATLSPSAERSGDDPAEPRSAS